MTGFNFNLKEKEEFKPSPLNRAQAIIIFRAVSGMSLGDSRTIVVQNFPDFDIPTAAFASMLEAWIKDQK